MPIDDNESVLFRRFDVRPAPEFDRISPVRYEFEEGAFWRRVPGFSRVSPEEFGDYHWQQQNCVTDMEDLRRILGPLCTPGLADEVRAGLNHAPMKLRITPYIVSLIDWSEPLGDPLRRQFLPFGSQFAAEHPAHLDDSLGEEDDRVAPLLVHRYPDKALFLPITICPIYCTFCTRSRLVGGSTACRAKAPYGARPAAWDETFAYLREHDEIEDVVVSGGDAFMLRPEVLRSIGDTLLDIPHVRRFRFATRGLAVLPMKITSDGAWVEALRGVCDRGRRMMKEVCVHTHFNSEREMSSFTVAAMRRLAELGVKVRNQSVLLRGVNDSFDVMHRTIKKLAYLQIQPYIVYLHDMVPGCEHLRTTLGCAERLAKQLQGTTATFNMPRFVCDAPGGGGKREISSYERYDPVLGISAWTAPTVKPGRVFHYYDPIDLLPPAGRRIWRNPARRKQRLGDWARG